MKKHFMDWVARGRCLLFAGKEECFVREMVGDCGIGKKNCGGVLRLRKVGDSLTLNRSRIGAGCVLCQADLFIRAEWSSPIRIWRGLCTFPAFSVLWSLRSMLFFEVLDIR